MSNKYRDVYFVNDEPRETICYLQAKAKDWFNGMTSNAYLDKVKKSWDYYHGIYYKEDHGISYGGEVGELVNIAVNHYHNIAKHILTMVTANRPSYQARAINTDHKSQVQVDLANDLLEYYMRQKNVEKKLKETAEKAVVLASGYMKIEWNATKGKAYDYVDPEPYFDEEGNPLKDEEGNFIDKLGKVLEKIPVYEGDLEFKSLDPLNVMFDVSKDSWEDQEWVVIRTFVNKYNLAAKYPELADKILEVPTKDKTIKKSGKVSLSPIDETDDVAVYELFHKRTEAATNGKYMLYLNEECILEDGAMPYRRLPVYRIVPSTYIGTSFGYTSMWDLMPIQQAVNSIYSTILTNQTAFGVQNVLNPEGNNLKVSEISGGLNFLDFTPVNGAPNGGAPFALNLTQTPAECFNYLQLLEKAMETISGINAVTRGNPEQNLRSGNALALIQSQALQYISGLQQEYIRLMEDVGTAIIEILQDYAEAPRIAEIVGKSNSARVEQFSRDNLDRVQRVIVDVGNALSQCLEKGTEVLMHDGSLKKVEDIVISDKVMGPDSKARTVKQANSGTEEMFKVYRRTKKKEFVYGCNASHIMTLKYCSDDSRYGVKKGDVIDIAVKDYIKLPERHKRILMGFKVGVDFDYQELPFDAYALGLWLGDGNKDRLDITTKDQELIDYWQDLAQSLGYNHGIHDQSETIKRVGFRKTEGKEHNAILKELGVFKNKNIPEIYIKNSRENRLKLLAGFIDSDGTLNGETFIISQKDNEMSKKLAFVARSLGFKVNLSKTISKGFDLESEINIITIGGNTWEIPTKLSRKQPSKVKKQKDWLNYGITVESQGVGTYYGFTLEEEPHFLLGDFTVTHNTTAGRSEMAQNLIQMGLIQTPEQYFSVLNSGNLETMTEGPTKKLQLIKAENEALVSGKDVIVIAIDDHEMHIAEHISVLSDPTLRFDNELVTRVLAHIQEHKDIQATLAPQFLDQATLAKQPPPSVPQTPAPPAPGGPLPPSELAQQADMGYNPQAVQNAAAAGVDMPVPPPNPLTGEPLTPKG